MNEHDGLYGGIDWNNFIDRVLNTQSPFTNEELLSLIRTEAKLDEFDSNLTKFLGKYVKVVINTYKDTKEITQVYFLKVDHIKNSRLTGPGIRVDFENFSIVEGVSVFANPEQVEVLDLKSLEEEIFSLTQEVYAKFLSIIKQDVSSL